MYKLEMHIGRSIGLRWFNLTVPGEKAIGWFMTDFNSDLYHLSEVTRSVGVEVLNGLHRED